jgi:putative transcriptional regulator
MNTPAPVVEQPLLALRARKASGLTREAFAGTYGLDVAAVRNWETGRREPDRAARVLLSLIETHPVMLAKLVAGLST